jgi:excisionase family DNA binding protein
MSEDPYAAFPLLWYSVKEAAENVNVHPETLRRAIRAGHLEAHSIGVGERRPTYRVSNRALARWLNERLARWERRNGYA